MWDIDLKKAFIQIACECKFGCAYIYARETLGSPPFRFYYNIWGSDRMWRDVKMLKREGFLVKVWRPQPSL